MFNNVNLTALWRIVRHPICVQGLALVALLWAGVNVLLSKEYSDAIRSAIEQGESTARLLAKDTIRLFKQADAKLLVLRQAYERDPQHFDFNANAEPLGVISESTINLALINADGYLVARTHLPLPSSGRVFVGDAEHFQAQIQPAADELYIALPLMLRSAGLHAVQVSRRLRQPDGSFGGIASATLDPDFVKQFAEAAGIKPGNTVSVRRKDGKVLASFGYTITDAPQGALSDALVRAPSGHVLSYGLKSEAGRRLLTYQTLSELPLVITVGELESRILSGYYAHRNLYVTIAVALTLMVILFVGFGLQRQLDSQVAHDNLRAAVESLPHGLTLFDVNGALIVSNMRYGDLYRLPEGLLRRGTPFQAIHEYCSKERGVKGLSRPDIWQLLARSGSAERINKHLELPDGHVVSLTQCPMSRGGWVTVHEDITEKLNADRQKEELQHRLAQSQKLEVVGQLTGGIAHDFNNLLLVVIGNLDLLKETAAPNSSELELIETSLTAALSGSELSNSLLAFSRRQRFKVEPVNVRTSVSEQIRLVRRAVGSKVVIEEKYADGDFVVSVDNAQFRSALTNLVVNARDAMPDGGTITLSTRGCTVPDDGTQVDPELPTGDYVVLDVKDTGSGMPPEVVNRIFEPFFTTKDVGKGTGLGLSMVYGFIKEMKGGIRVASKVGEGTTFSIYLPVEQSLPVVAAPSLAPSADMPPSRQQQRTILVVDDCDSSKAGCEPDQLIGVQSDRDRDASQGT
jgi:signal transduction histidine kinase